MARRTKLFTVTAEGRDKGKTFLLTEMAAEPAEEWALRAFLALARSGVDVPPDIAQHGWSGVIVYGIRAMNNLAWEDAKPLLDEMFKCVRVVADPVNYPSIDRVLIPGDFEEIETRITIRRAVFELHAGFFMKDGP